MRLISKWNKLKVKTFFWNVIHLQIYVIWIRISLRHCFFYFMAYTLEIAFPKLMYGCIFETLLRFMLVWFVVSYLKTTSRNPIVASASAVDAFCHCLRCKCSGPSLSLLSTDESYSPRSFLPLSLPSIVEGEGCRFLRHWRTPFGAFAIVRSFCRCRCCS